MEQPSEVLEIVARTIIGTSAYEALPERATYLQRKSNGAAQWHDRAEAREDARAVVEALEQKGFAIVKVAVSLKAESAHD